MIKILLILLLSINVTYAVDCNKHKIYCQIVSNSPSINTDFAMKLSNAIYISSTKYDISSNLVAAILMQESNYNMTATNCTWGLDEFFTRTKVCQDYGIIQLNYRNILRLEINIEKLMTNVEYAVDIAVKLLYDFKKRYGSKEDIWWTRYNSPTWQNRIIYKELVSKYLRDLD